MYVHCKRGFIAKITRSVAIELPPPSAAYNTANSSALTHKQQLVCAQYNTDVVIAVMYNRIWLTSFVRSASFKLYCSYALSTWADQLWQFTLSLALIHIGGDLRLIAINGLVSGSAVLFFASSVGRWIDNTRRLTAARTTLTLANISVALSLAIISLIFVQQQRDISSLWNFAIRTLLITLVFLLCTVSILAQTGTKIILTKDWVVVMCNDERNKLADMNASLLRIELAATILAPLKAGLLIKMFSVSAGCAFIAIWIMCSLSVEFRLLSVVYHTVPALAVKHSPNATLVANPKETNAVQTIQPEAEVLTSRIPICWAKFSNALREAKQGWYAYYHQPVFPVALGLSLLYLTVLDFDGITIGYAFSQGLPADVLAVFRGIGALMGIIGSVLYPLARSKFGLIHTGLLSFLLELLCLSLCIVSIWLPGSHFDPNGFLTGSVTSSYRLLTSASSEIVNQALNFSVSIESIAPDIDIGYSYCSIWTFIIGVVLARCGLWMTDLSVTQIMQESIAEHERGIVNGVQSSTNQLLSMIKDLMVIVLPDPRTFGFLIIVSWLSILCGFFSFSVYARRSLCCILPMRNFFRHHEQVIIQCPQ